MVRAGDGMREDLGAARGFISAFRPLPCAFLSGFFLLSP